MARAAIPKRRISGGTKASMLVVALVLDYLVIIVFVFAVVFILQGIVGSGFAKTFVSHQTTRISESCAIADAGFAGGGFWAYTKYRLQVRECAMSKFALGSGAAIAGGIAIGGPMLVFPIMAAILSVFAGLAYQAIFTLWFWARGVNMWEVKLGRMGLNMATFVFESIPLMNLLVPMMTLSTWGHIQIANREDDAKIRAAKAQLKKGMRTQERSFEEELAIA